MFSAEASASLAGPDWLRQRRAGGYEAFASTPLPSESEEVWRYSPIDELSLDDFAPSDPDATNGGPAAGVALLAEVRRALGRTAGSLLVHGGRPVLSTLARGDDAVADFAFGGAGDV